MTTATLMDKKSPSSRALDRLTGRYYPALTDGFIALKEFQGFVSSHNGPVDVDDLPVYVTAMIVEWAEFLQETNWKPWKPAKPVDMERLADEFADTLAFLGVIMIMLGQLGLNADDIAAAYIKKSGENIRRFTGEVPEYKFKERYNE